MTTNITPVSITINSAPRQDEEGYITTVQPDRDTDPTETMYHLAAGFVVQAATTKLDPNDQVYLLKMIASSLGFEYGND